MGITYHWPWGPLWRGRCHTSWQGHFHWLWPQTGQSAHTRKTQTQLPESESTAVKVKIRNRICKSHHCQQLLIILRFYTWYQGVLTLSGSHQLPQPAARRAQACRVPTPIKPSCISTTPSYWPAQALLPRTVLPPTPCNTACADLQETEHWTEEGNEPMKPQERIVNQVAFINKHGATNWKLFSV